MDEIKERYDIEIKQITSQNEEKNVNGICIFKAIDKPDINNKLICKRWNGQMPKHPIRNEFQRDRDRILYSRAFRRLSGKTQVFTSTTDDHVRTRLTHTLEVSQIARTISKELGLSEDLTEAIALGHDLGHTPFGHVGERTLNAIMNGCYIIEDFNEKLKKYDKGFKHNWQSARVVNELESESLNLTKETIWGIIHHSSIKDKKCKKDSFIECNFKHKKKTECGEMLSYGFYENIYNDLNPTMSWSFEGLVVAIADEIAQRHHDIEDAIEFDILTKEEIYSILNEKFRTSLGYDENRERKDLLEKINNESNIYNVMATFSKFIVDFLTTDLINQSKINLLKIKDRFRIVSQHDFYNKKEEIYKHHDILENSDENEFIFNIIQFSKEVMQADKSLQQFLSNKILKSYKAQRMDGLGSYIIGKLFEAYLNNPQQLRDKSVKTLYKNIKNQEERFREIRDKCEGDKTLVNYILKKFVEINNVGDKRDFIGDLHYKIIQSQSDKNSQIESIYKNELLRTICDYISGMTGKFAIEDHKLLYNC